MTKKKKKQKLQLIDYFIIICLALLAFCILFLIFDKDDKKEVVDDSIVVSENEKVGFKLNGKENLVIKKGSKYNEKGFAAFSSLEDDISEYVTVSGNVDTSEAGIYKIYYTLEYKTINKTLERTVEVVDKYSIMIKGDPVIYVLKDTEYKDLGVEVTASDGSKLEHEVEIDNKVDTSKEGDYYVTYKVTYGDEEKELMRKVVVYTLDYTITTTSFEITMLFNDSKKK